MSVFTNIVNKFINVRNQTLNANGDWQPMRLAGQEIRVLGASNEVVGSELVVFDERPNDIIIDALEWSTNDNNTYVKLNVNDSPESNNYLHQVFHTVNPKGTSRWKCTPVRVANDGHSHFEMVSYDTTNDEYKMNLKMPIIIPKGAHLSFHHDSPAGSEVVTYKVVYRVL